LTNKHTKAKVLQIKGMKKILCLVFVVLSTCKLYAQNSIEWSPEYELQLSDFKSEASSIGGNNISIYTGSNFDFSFHMSQYEFMFTKNFNSKVVTNFLPEAAYYNAPDSQMAKYLVEFARLSFDLTELYARKFRQELFIQKGGFSNVSFFQPIYNDIVKEHALKHSELSKTTDLGRNQEQTKIARQQILAEITQLSDFCKTCKPKKKKKA
jgi:hypothetical protein